MIPLILWVLFKKKQMGHVVLGHPLPSFHTMFGVNWRCICDIMQNGTVWKLDIYHEFSVPRA